MASIFIDFYYPISWVCKTPHVDFVPLTAGFPMTFLLRAVFWTAVVVVFVPGATLGTGQKDQFQTLESLKADAILTLARVRMELNARNSRAP